MISRAAAILVVVAVPLFLITGSVAWAVNDLGLYQRGFEKYQVSLWTGIPHEDLRQAGADIRRYFNSLEEPLVVRARLYGEEREIFNQREVLHMKDVKHLVWGVYAVGAVSMLYLLGFSAGGFVRYGRAFSPTLAGLALRGGLLTLALVGLVGLLALAGFETLFTLFHHISFANDLWQLDPCRDYLIMMFPLGFWFDATMRVAATAVGGALLLAGTSGAYLYRRRRADQGQARPTGRPEAGPAADN
jgi:integral membrane protein (TIGR01906 family)